MDNRSHQEHAKQQTRTLRVGFLTSHNPFDRNAFSGTVYYMRRAIEDHPDMELKVIGEKFHQSKFAAKCLHLLDRVGGKFAEPGYSLYSQFFAFFAEAELLKRSDIDVIVAPIASSVIARFTQTKKLPPIIFITDATPNYIQEAYHEKLTPSAIHLEQKALIKSRHVVYSSDFMAARARQEFPYALTERHSKVSVVPFGLNIDQPPAFDQPKSIKSPLELLFIGKFWERKGGDIALDTIKSLTERGIDCRLTVIGCQPSSPLPDNVELHTYLNKNNKADCALFNEIQQRSHFLLLPTRADCTPMVIAEANTYGMPVICTDVGGVGTLVKDNINGVLKQFADGGESYADTIISIINNQERYTKLSLSSRQTYESTLNWDAWSHEIERVAAKTLKSNVVDLAVKRATNDDTTTPLMAPTLESGESYL